MRGGGDLQVGGIWIKEAFGGQAELCREGRREKQTNRENVCVCERERRREKQTNRENVCVCERERRIDRKDHEEEREIRLNGPLAGREKYVGRKQTNRERKERDK